MYLLIMLLFVLYNRIFRPVTVYLNNILKSRKEGWIGRYQTTLLKSRKECWIGRYQTTRLVDIRQPV